MPQIDKKPTDDTASPVEDESLYEVPKPSADEDEYESSTFSSDYSPTPSENQDDVDSMAGNFDDYDYGFDASDGIEFFCDVIQWFL
jgi:hypothetical protein